MLHDSQRRLECDENVIFIMDSSSTVEGLKQEFYNRRGVPIMKQVLVEPRDKERFSTNGFEHAYLNNDIGTFYTNACTFEFCDKEETFLLFVERDDDDDGIIFLQGADTQIINEDDHCNLL